MGKTQIQPIYPRGVTFEQVWSALQDTDRLLKETIKASERDREENEKHRKQYEKEREKERKEYNKRFGEYDSRFGEVVEHMIAPNLKEKFTELGYIFQKSSNDMKVEDFTNNIFFEIDVYLENSEKAMLVEIKTRLNNKYINEHIERLDKMRKYADLHNDKHTFLGAVAGVVIPANVKDYALSKGLFVIKPSGETFNITAPRSKPAEW